jgi:multidrug efflux pump subunit AcrB
VGFVIALGLLVDDAIVVVENVSRHLRMGKTRVTAAIDGTKEISLAVLGSTATLLLAFLPLVFLPGTAGLFIRSLPMAVLFTVLASLAISLTIVPLLASLWLSEQDEHGNVFLRVLNRSIERTYRPVLDRAIRYPRVALSGAGRLFAVSVALVPVVGFSLFPQAGIPQFRVTIDAGDGAALAATDAAVRFVEAELARHPQVVATMANVGAGNPRIYYNVSPANARSGVGEVFARLDTYDSDTPELLDGLRATLAAYPGARLAVKEFENGPPVDAPVAVRLVGDDLGALREASAQVAAVLRRTPGLISIEDPLANPRTELKLRIDRDTAGQLGVPVAEAARAARFALAGLDVGTLRDASGGEIPIVARVAGVGEPTLERLEQLTVAGSGGPVALREIAEIGFSASPARINHEDGDRAVSVIADVTTGTNVAEVTQTVMDGVRALTLPAGVRWEASGEAESRSESFDGVGVAGLVAAFGILAVLVLEFRTFRSTLVVASVVPLGLTGGVLALWITGNTLSFTAAIGFVALIGIEVKNSILLVDFANQLRRDGWTLDAAIARAGETRFVPILLTTATALGGLLPIALEGSALYSPLAIVIIGGLLSSTILTRLVTPVAYKLLAPTIEPEPALRVDALPATA